VEMDDPEPDVPPPELGRESYAMREKVVTKIAPPADEQFFNEPQEPPPDFGPEFYAKRDKLNTIAQSLGTDKFDLDDKTVRVEKVATNPEDYHILDARSAEEMEVGMIPNSISRASFEASPKNFEGKPVVVYCTVGYIGGGCARELINKGHENVKTLGDGALLGYTLHQTESGIEKPLVKQDGTPTNQVHTFSPDLAPLAGDGMECTYFEDPSSVLREANRDIRRALHGWNGFEMDDDDICEEKVKVSG